MIASDHARFEELSCLRVYGELEPDEERALTEHLAACDRCRRFAAELGDGLATIAARDAQAGTCELPPDWRAALESKVRSRGAPRRAPLFAFAAGVAAGLLVLPLASSLRAAIAPRSAPADAAPVIASNAAPPSTPPRFDAAPPRSTSRGQAALLGLIRGR